jgi:hypothetical protein
LALELAQNIGHVIGARSMKAITHDINPVALDDSLVAKGARNLALLGQERHVRFHASALKGVVNLRFARDAFVGQGALPSGGDWLSISTSMKHERTGILAIYQGHFPFRQPELEYGTSGGRNARSSIWQLGRRLVREDWK